MSPPIEKHERKMFSFWLCCKSTKGGTDKRRHTHIRTGRTSPENVVKPSGNFLSAPNPNPLNACLESDKRCACSVVGQLQPATNAKSNNLAKNGRSFPGFPDSALLPRNPYSNRLQKQIWYPYSSLSTGGASFFGGPGLPVCFVPSRRRSRQSLPRSQ